ncbi:hypothetical protein PC9H_011616 [Pleurotus ostreatus]|uniref:BBC1/AIM3 cysteine proteinase-fold domain-containing protein n=1 Tax=Pleurotus ostreatus TaxID=5322 RepID=A0A8H6ZJ14_PLEOS|nr:uncharacterized protein PC9H_011616 [Pleurotus ostreatus]KAF7421096.1 hypothetical protein PC9H_011616 [Pleurotus ostreatus]KAJ8690614.1 hypothetical protein PTI98_012027 [Pleurotus ostreatus]
MPSFAELRERAAKAADAGRHKFNDTVDRNTSVPMKSTNWDPYSKKAPPPPPPSRSAAANDQGRPSSSTPPPPRVNIANRPTGLHPVGSDEIDWANLSPDDKEAFFSWLDEYFERLFKVGIQPQNPGVRLPPVHQPRAATSPASTVKSGVGPPPKVATWSRPNTTPTSNNSPSDFPLSHPPPTVHGSSALDLAYFFHPSAHWSSPWYDADNILPPPLHGNSDHRFAGSWQSRNADKQVFVGLLFADLSLCWGVVDYSTKIHADPNDTLLVRRQAQYLPRPKALEREPLVRAHETYGETIAAFAESFVGTGQYCSRGECWDLASEALKYFDQFDYVPKPVPSISRTHGHLIFEGKANGVHKTVGRWRGGDDRVRRGDIVEWRKVKIGLVGGAPGSWAILGDPDHTAVIVRDSTIAGGRTVRDGDSVKPGDLGSLEVVEQSVGSPPDRKEYDLNAFEEGEMWIYRPIGMKDYMGCELAAKAPEDVATMSI